jgi:hypothetical protein
VGSTVELKLAERKVEIEPDKISCIFAENPRHAAQARILDWIAMAVPNLDEVILQHVQTNGTNS